MTVKRAQLRRDVDSIKTDIDELRADVSGALRDLVSASRNHAGEVRDKVQAQLSAGARSVARRGKRAVESVEGAIEERPLQAVGVALGLGLLAGILLTRKRK